MRFEEFFYCCSKEYIHSIDPSLYSETSEIIEKLPKRQKQEEINNDLFWLLTSKGWAYDTLSNITDNPPPELGIANVRRSHFQKKHERSPCLTSTTLDASWHTDFGKAFGAHLVQVEAQFGKVESMFKDFCGFRIARHERRLALGIEIVLCEPSKYFAHRRNAVGGMAYFDIARNTLPAIGLDCPIWLIGIKE